jgi:hypothetical protein
MGARIVESKKVAEAFTPRGILFVVPLDFWHKKRMIIARFFSNILLSVLFLLSAGCGKTRPRDETEVTPVVMPPSPDSIVRLHWIGRRHIDLDADAYYVSRIWSLAESRQLQQQACDKLSANAMRLIFGDSIVRVPPAIFRPMFDDIALQECYFELRVPTNSNTANWCFAIHAGQLRAGPWATNLVLASEISTGGTASFEPAVHGWTVQGTNANKRAIVARFEDWVIVSIGSPKDTLFEEVAGQLFRGNSIRLTEGTANYWLEAEIDPNRAERAFSIPKCNSELPRVSFRVTGDGSHVITQGQLTFSDALSQPMKAWNIPANYIHEPLLSFASIRGIQPLLGKWEIWSGLHIAPPDQVYLWSLESDAYQTYVAAPSARAKNDVSAISDFLLQKGNLWLSANGYIGFHSASDADGVVWGNVPSLTPFIRSLNSGTENWIYGGLLADPGIGTNASLSNRILRRLTEETNLVYYGWELTGQALSPRLSLLQTARQIGRKPEIPTDCVSLNWLGALRQRLGPTETTMKQTGAKELTFYRKSTIGFTALELHLLADWLESPDFPRGTRSHWGINETTH